jgi:hypothetical protein
MIGAILMTNFEHGVNRLLKFLLYVVFFATISSPAFVSSSRYSCRGVLSRLRKRS